MGEKLNSHLRNIFRQNRHDRGVVFGNIDNKSPIKNRGFFFSQRKKSFIRKKLYKIHIFYKNNISHYYKKDKVFSSESEKKKKKIRRNAERHYAGKLPYYIRVKEFSSDWDSRGRHRRNGCSARERAEKLLARNSSFLHKDQNRPYHRCSRQRAPRRRPA